MRDKKDKMRKKRNRDVYYSHVNRKLRDPVTGERMHDIFEYTKKKVDAIRNLSEKEKMEQF